MTLDFGLAAGKYVASPRVGVLVGLSVDVPSTVWHHGH